MPASSSFEIDRVYAYAITPQRAVDAEAREEPRGGIVPVDKAVVEIIATSFNQLRENEMSSVVFEGFEGVERTHPVRDALMAIAFGQTQAPKAAALKLAARLSSVSDERSRDSLVVVVAEKDGDRRRVTLLVLPKENVLQLKNKSAEQTVLRMLADAFGAGSHLRKVARAQGVNAKSQFMTVDIYDYQFRNSDRAVADFWMRNFLQARYHLDSQSGTKELSAALRRALLESPTDERDAVFGAMHKLSSGAVPQTSLQLFADTEVPQNLHDAYFRGVQPHMRKPVFDVAVPLMKQSLGRRIIVTNDGIVVSAPNDIIGTPSIKVETATNGARRVSVNSSVKEERVNRDRKQARREAKRGAARRPGAE